MKILFLNYEYPPLGGGAGNATFYILREFSKIPNLEVDLVTSSHDENFHLGKIGNNVRIHKLPIGKNRKNLHFQSQKDLLIYSWKAYWYGNKLLRKGHFSLTHSFFSVPCGFISLLFKWQYKIPYIVSLRGADVPGYSERFSFIYGLLKPLVKIIWKKADAVVSNSEGLRELALKSKPDQKIEIIFNGVDTDHFRPEIVKRGAEHFIITTGASRLTARKGLAYLFRAVNQLKNKYPKIIIKIMGEGSEKNNLEKLASELGIINNIQFLGRIPKDLTFSRYQEANLFVLPSLNEGMSNAMLEALASGMPILATNTGGTKELVTEGENGFIIKMKNSQDIAEKIEIFLKNKELLLQMGKRSREIAISFSWESVAKKYFNLYEEI